MYPGIYTIWIHYIHPLVERSICFYRTYIHIASRFRKVESGPIRLTRTPHLNPIQIRTSLFQNLQPIPASRIPKKSNNIFPTENEQTKTAFPTTIQQCDTCPSGRVIYSIPVVEIRLSFVLFAPVSFCSGPGSKFGKHVRFRYLLISFGIFGFRLCLAYFRYCGFSIAKENKLSLTQDVLSSSIWKDAVIGSSRNSQWVI